MLGTTDGVAARRPSRPDPVLDPTKAVTMEDLPPLRWPIEDASPIENQPLRTRDKTFLGQRSKESLLRARLGVTVGMTSPAVTIPVADEPRVLLPVESDAIGDQPDIDEVP